MTSVLDTRKTPLPPREELEKITHIGIDEIFWGKRILTVIQNLETGKLLDVLPDREPDTLREFFKTLKPLQGDTRPIFVADMWGPFRTALREVYLAERQQVADRFHIQAKIKEDLQESARAILHSASLDQVSKKVTHVLNCFQTSCDLRSKSVMYDVPAAQLQQLRSVLDLASDLRGLWSCADLAQGQEHLAAWYGKQTDVENQLKAVGVSGRHFSRLSYVLKDWETEVLGYLDPRLELPGARRPTTGPLEAANGQIRQLLKRSSVQSRRAFITEPSASDEQIHFARIRERILYQSSQPQKELQPCISPLRPVVRDCDCGTPADQLTICQIKTTLVWDRPLGDQTVRATLEQLTVQCPSCGERWPVPHGCEDNITPLLRDDILAWRREGVSLRTLRHVTGVPAARLRKVAREDQAVPRIHFPELVGLQRWHWRGQLHWIISDPRHGTLVDLIPAVTTESANHLRTWLLNASTQGTSRVLVDRVSLSHSIPGPLEPLADRFTVMQPVQKSLQRVLRRVLSTIHTQTLRTPEFSRVRFLFLSNGRCYRRLNDRLNGVALKKRLAVLEQDPRFEAVCIAREHVESLRIIYKLKRERDIKNGFHEWTHKTLRLSTQKLKHKYTYPGENDLFWALRNNAALFIYCQQAIIKGLFLQSTEGVSLASTRLLVRRLNAHPARMQPDYEYFRRTALFSLGNQAALAEPE